MNNREARNKLQKAENNCRKATSEMLALFDLPESQFSMMNRKFQELTTVRREFVRHNDLDNWEILPFYEHGACKPSGKMRSDGTDKLTDTISFVEALSNTNRKSISAVTLQTIRTRLMVLLDHITFLAERENTDSRTIAALALQCISNDNYDRDTAKLCHDVAARTAPNQVNRFPLEKASFMLDLLEIGKRKYIDLRRICKSEDIHFPGYKKIVAYRNEICSAQEISVLNNEQGNSIGVNMPYSTLVHKTTERIVQLIPCCIESQYPLTLTIADGLDGSGSHRLYNQIPTNPSLSTKSLILFAFKALSLIDKSGKEIWSNPCPNSPFVTRPVALVSQKENYENVNYLMKTLVNPETCSLESNGLELCEGHVNVIVKRTLFDGKMSAILSGAGGAVCQLCTANRDQLKDIELVKYGFPINRHVKDAIDIFSDVNPEEFLKLPSEMRFGLTHPPASDINILPVSPLHSYLCVFRWFMLLIYHLDANLKKWSPTSPKIKKSMDKMRTLLLEKTGFHIDLPSCDGGTSTTGNIARSCFLNEKEFIKWATSTLLHEDKSSISLIRRNLSVILRLYSSSSKLDTFKLNSFCKETYQFVLITFPWASITPSLHKLLAHSVELVADYNNGCGMKILSEECIESLNKYVRRYREKLSRKFTFEDNIKDVFMRILCQSDPVLASYRMFTEKTENNICKLSEEDFLVNSFILE